MGQLIQRIADKLPASGMHLNTPVQAVRKEEAGWIVELQHSSEKFDAVVIALPAPQAAEVVRDLPSLANPLRQIPYAGCSVAILTVDEKQIRRPVAGFGFVVPEIENRKILAVSFSSAKFPGRAPLGKVVIRVFVGGACHPELADLSDKEMREVVKKELAELIGLEGDFERYFVARWMGKMPQYHLGHLDRVAELEEAAAKLLGLELAGNAYRGVGVPQCIQSGEQAAGRVMAFLKTVEPSSHAETN